MTIVSPTSPESFSRPAWRGWIHAGGAAAIAVATPFLVLRTRTMDQVIWVACYLTGVFAMMATSAIFHRITWSSRMRRIWKRADHSMIFAAIVGSDFAIMGLTLHGSLRVIMLVVVAVGAVTGIAVGQFAIDAPKWVHTVPYLVVGWAATAVIPQIYRGGGALCLVLVISGGVTYSLGAAVYAAKRPRLAPQTFGYHELFHAATIVGATLHYGAIWAALH